METLNWLQNIIANGSLCDEYTRKVDVARSKKQIADIALDYNGASFLCEMADKGMPLPYDVLEKEFKPFINGRYASEHTTASGTTYDVAMWCRHPEHEVVASTTVTTLLGCELDVVVPKNHYAVLFVDANCKIRVFCMEGARCRVNYWGDAIVENPKQNKYIKIKKRNG